MYVRMYEMYVHTRMLSMYVRIYLCMRKMRSTRNLLLGSQMSTAAFNRVS
jgi:hypothetical protein